MNNVKKEKRKCKEDTTHASKEQNLSVGKFQSFGRHLKRKKRVTKGAGLPILTFLKAPPRQSPEGKARKGKTADGGDSPTKPVMKTIV